MNIAGRARKRSSGSWVATWRCRKSRMLCTWAVKSRARSRQREVRVIVFFDIGSTLIDGPKFGPARRLADTLGLGPETVGQLEHILFRSPARDPEELANTLVNRLRVDFDQAFEACTNLWNAQLQEAYVLPGARELIESLKSA